MKSMLSLVYIRWKRKNGHVECRLDTGKTQVVSVVKITIPPISRCIDKALAHGEQVCAADTPIHNIWPKTLPDPSSQGADRNAAGVEADHSYSAQVWKGWLRQTVREERDNN